MISSKVKCNFDDQNGLKINNSKDLQKYYLVVMIDLKGGSIILNQLVLVGRLTRKPELKVTENDKQVSYVTLAVPRSFKNLSGEYETDFFDCVLWDKVASNTVEFCDKGDVVALKGRVQSRVIELGDGSKRKQIDLIAEKINFLTLRKKAENSKDTLTLEDEIVDTSTA